MQLRYALAIAALALSPVAAYASPNCTTESSDNWMSKQDMKTKIEELGYKIKTFEVTGNCYEIYGWTSDDKRAEVYFNPVTGDVVEAEIDG
ncbi:hypothetical protein GCM10007989_16220 [Devosia pacifica]|uniref:PepSY domain-containing protein n=1 Tax=Devosia pacifica TaxID=1335967 RepID=A0A918S2K9_9HYPH|nr:PepSY domain-containing protein [Devosia pacifica]GHA21643.1 hypothetical protein GCM10007989_16220 [Devosia pacifica]